METTVDIPIKLHKVRDKNGEEVPVEDLWADTDNDINVELAAVMPTKDEQQMLEFIRLKNITYGRLIELVVAPEEPPF